MSTCHFPQCIKTIFVRTGSVLWYLWFCNLCNKMFQILSTYLLKIAYKNFQKYWKLPYWIVNSKKISTSLLFLWLELHRPGLSSFLPLQWRIHHAPAVFISISVLWLSFLLVLVRPGFESFCELLLLVHLHSCVFYDRSRDDEVIHHLMSLSSDQDQKISLALTSLWFAHSTSSYYLQVYCSFGPLKFNNSIH